MTFFKTISKVLFLSITKQWNNITIKTIAFPYESTVKKKSEDPIIEKEKFTSRDTSKEIKNWSKPEQTFTADFTTVSNKVNPKDLKTPAQLASSLQDFKGKTSDPELKPEPDYDAEREKLRKLNEEINSFRIAHAPVISPKPDEKSTSDPVKIPSQEEIKKIAQELVDAGITKEQIESKIAQLEARNSKAEQEARVEAKPYIFNGPSEDDHMEASGSKTWEELREIAQGNIERQNNPEIEQEIKSPYMSLEDFKKLDSGEKRKKLQEVGMTYLETIRDVPNVFLDYEYEQQLKEKENEPIKEVGNVETEISAKHYKDPNDTVPSREPNSAKYSNGFEELTEEQISEMGSVSREHEDKIKESKNETSSEEIGKIEPTLSEEKPGTIESQSEGKQHSDLSKLGVKIEPKVETNESEETYDSLPNINIIEDEITKARESMAILNSLRGVPQEDFKQQVISGSMREDDIEDNIKTI